MRSLATMNNAAIAESDQEHDGDNSIGALVRSRILSSLVVESSSFRFGVDPDWLRAQIIGEETKGESEQPHDHAVVEVKTLIWEIAHSSDAAGTNKTYVVTALRIDDKVDVGCLENIVRDGCPTSNISVSLAPREVAENLTGYQSGTMAPICHTVPMPLYVDESIFGERTSKLTIVCVGSGTVRHSLFLRLDDMMSIAESTSAAVNVRTFVDQEGGTKRPFVLSKKHYDVPKETTAQLTTFAPKPRKSGYTHQEPKDRLTEYRMLPSTLERSQLLRTTARKKGRLEEMKRLVNEAVVTGEFNDVMCPGPNGSPAKNAMHLAAWKGDYETVVLLAETSKLHSSLDDTVNQVSTGIGSYGKSAIFYALTQCRDEVVLYLISEGGASLLVVNNKGQTPCSIAFTRVRPETCEKMYEVEEQQLKDGGTFVNYRESHSDGKLYGDLDPRFRIDEDNMGSDIDEPLTTYRESIVNAEWYGGVPSCFSPRSLRPTTRWWSRDDALSEAAKLDRSDQSIFTQSRPKQKSCKRKTKCKGNKVSQQENLVERNAFEPDLNSLERLTLGDALLNADNNLTRGIITIVEDISGIHILLEAISHSIQCAKLEIISGESPRDSFLAKFAWGLDCEWKPGRDFGNDNPVATLQLSTRNHAFLIDVQTLCRRSVVDEEETLTKSEALISQALMILFTHSDIALLGFGILQDLDKLAASFPHLECFTLFHGVVDLQAVAKHVISKGSKQHTNSLQKVVAMHTNRFLEKSEQCSDWTTRPLSNEQIE